MVGPEISRRLPYYKDLKITFAEGFGISLFLGTSMAHNYLRKRPFSSSILKHVSLAVAGLYAGKQLDKFNDSKRNEKVLVIEDYICRHPEDFPLVTPKKYKDVLMPWYPLR